MSAALLSSCALPCAAKVSRRSVQAPMGNLAGLQRHSVSLRSGMSGSKRVGAIPHLEPTAVHQRTVQTPAAMEVFQLADELSYISGVAAVVFAVTLVGLAAGFVLLRVEALTEEGKL